MIPEEPPNTLSDRVWLTAIVSIEVPYSSGTGYNKVGGSKKKGAVPEESKEVSIYFIPIVRDIAT